MIAWRIVEMRKRPLILDIFYSDVPHKANQYFFWHSTYYNKLLQFYTESEASILT